ncbi:hypothetical protein IEQ34_019200 [Dendrobium chrysotoxum]|uniref:Uncharacterized protein n=1 Tax=Dendrobium chrysotoxum TaxID=161865 RepID=A0AAV7G6F4_DENCH|nr:hypothetical protein IEQ34_019200 [Dendrobium chrysotoxum]
MVLVPYSVGLLKLILLPQLALGHQLLNVTKHFPDRVWVSPKNLGYIQSVVMENFSSYCDHCKSLGHSKVECRILHRLLNNCPTVNPLPINEGVKLSSGLQWGAGVVGNWLLPHPWTIDDIRLLSELVKLVPDVPVILPILAPALANLNFINANIDRIESIEYVVNISDSQCAFLVVDMVCSSKEACEVGSLAVGEKTNMGLCDFNTVVLNDYSSTGLVVASGEPSLSSPNPALSPNTVVSKLNVSLFDVPVSIISNEESGVVHSNCLDESFSSSCGGDREELDGPDDEYQAMFNSSVAFFGPLAVVGIGFFLIPFYSSVGINKLLPTITDADVTCRVILSVLLHLRISLDN